MIQQYEMKYQKLTAELADTQRLLAVETSSKSQFESDLKRVFLKNLTHMNMEAYALFNNGAPPGTDDMEADSSEPVSVRVPRPLENTTNIMGMGGASDNTSYQAARDSKQKVKFADTRSAKGTQPLPSRGPGTVVRGNVQKTSSSNKKSIIMTVQGDRKAHNTKSGPVATSSGPKISGDVDLRRSIENQIPRPYLAVPTPQQF